MTGDLRSIRMVFSSGSWLESSQTPGNFLSDRAEESPVFPNKPLSTHLSV